MIKLNRLVAFSYVNPVEKSLQYLDELEEEFNNYQPFYAAKADFLFRMKAYKEAKVYFLKAIRLSGNSKEKEFLKGRLVKLGLGE